VGFSRLPLDVSRQSLRFNESVLEITTATLTSTVTRHRGSRYFRQLAFAFDPIPSPILYLSTQGWLNLTCASLDLDAVARDGSSSIRRLGSRASGGKSLRASASGTCNPDMCVDQKAFLYAYIFIVHISSSTVASSLGHLHLIFLLSLAHGAPTTR
jgi:hypothetical protein